VMRRRDDAEEKGHRDYRERNCRVARGSHAAPPERIPRMQSPEGSSVKNKKPVKGLRMLARQSN
jgi:hypothetical protein